MTRRVAWMIGLMAVLGHVPVAAQVGVGVRYGYGRGSAAYNVGEIQARVHAVGYLYATGAFEIIGGNWSCPASPRNAVICGYDGRSVSVGPALALAKSERIYVAARGTVGWFERTGRYGGEEYRGSDHATVSVAMDGEVTLFGPVGIQVGVSHRRIDDGRYRDVTGERPHLTAFTLGIGLVFGG